jgi:hypothetical protein
LSHCDVYHTESEVVVEPPSSPYFASQVRDYTLNAKPTVPAPRSPISPSAPYSQSSPKRDCYRTNSFSRFGGNKRLITQAKILGKRKVTSSQGGKSGVIGQCKPRPTLTRHKAMIFNKPPECQRSSDTAMPSSSTSDGDVLMSG